MKKAKQLSLTAFKFVVVTSECLNIYLVCFQLRFLKIIFGIVSLLFFFCSYYLQDM